MDMQIMVHKTSSLENTLLKCWIIRCQIKGILLCTFVSYDGSAKQDVWKIIVKMWRGSNTEEYKITVPSVPISISVSVSISASFSFAVLSNIVYNKKKKKKDNTTCKKNNL
jgi:hypothetical protein